MLAEYIQAAMAKATYEVLKDDGTHYGEIPDCRGVWANADTPEECRRELQEVLEDWILVGVWHHQKLPVIDGIDLNLDAVQQVA
jgi:predicted RNase H-like HicB family nuclease